MQTTYSTTTPTRLWEASTVALVSLVEALAAGLPWEAVEGIVSRSSTDGNVRSDLIQIHPSSPTLRMAGWGRLNVRWRR